MKSFLGTTLSVKISCDYSLFHVAVLTRLELAVNIPFYSLTFSY